MFSLLKLANKYYWKSIIAPVATFIFPLFYVWMACSLYTFPGSDGSVTFIGFTVIPSASLLSVYLISMIFMPQSIFEIKDSIIFKRLKSTTIKPWMIFFVNISFYTVVSIISFIIGVGFLPLEVMNSSLYTAVQLLYNQIDYGLLFYTLVVNILLASSIGIFILSFAKSSVFISGVGLFMIVLSIVLAGFLVPMNLAKLYAKPLWNISYIDPIRYGTLLAYGAWFPTASTFNIFGSGIFDFSSGIYGRILPSVNIAQEIMSASDKVSNFFVPYIFCLFSLTFASIKLGRVK